VTSIYFTGNAPAADYSAFVGYESSNIPTAYYLPGTSGWGPTYAGIPALPWGGDFTYATNAGSISISSYYGDDGTVYIPTTINGLPVTSIGSGAFVGCTNLVNITIPDNVTNIADAAFQDCDNLASIYFTGNAPAADPSAFEDSTNGITPTVYYLPGASGWSSTFAGFPAVLWNPQIQTTGTNFGVSGNQFGFNITGTNNFTALVETSTNLAGPVWSVLQTVTLVNGSYSFTDPQWTNYPGRYYTLVMP